MENEYIYYYRDVINNEINTGLIGNNPLSAYLAVLAANSDADKKMYMCRMPIDIPVSRFEEEWKSQLEEYERQLHDIMPQIVEHKCIDLEFYSQSKTIFMLRSAEYPALTFSHFGKYEDAFGGRDKSDFTYQLKEYEAARKQIFVDVVYKNKELNYDIIKQKYKVGDIVDAVITSVRSDLNMVFLDFYGYQTCTCLSTLLQEPSELKRGMHLKLYINEFNDEKRQIRLQQTSCGLKLESNMLGKHIELVKGNEYEVIPFYIHKQYGVLVNYQGYKGCIPRKQFKNAVDMSYLVTLGQPLICKFSNKNSTGFLYWNLLIEVSKEEKKMIESKSLDSDKLMQFLEKEKSKELGIFVVRRNIQIPTEIKKGDKVPFVTSCVNNGMIIGKVGSENAMMAMENLNWLFVPEYWGVNVNNVIAMGITLTATIVGYDKDAHMIVLTHSKQDDKVNLLNEQIGCEVKLCPLCKYYVYVIAEIENKGLALIQPNILKRTLHEFQEMSLNQDLYLTIIRLKRNSIQWEPMVQYVYEFVSGMDYEYVSVKIQWQCLGGAFVTTPKDVIMWVPWVALGGKYANQEIIEYRQFLLPLDRSRPYMAKITQQPNSFGCPIELTDTVKNPLHSFPQEVEGIIVSVQGEGTPFVWYLVDLGDYVGRVNANRLSWRKDDKEVEEAIKNKTPLKFIATGIFKNLKNILYLNHLKFADPGIVMDKTYEGTINNVGAKEVELLLDNGLMAFADVQAVRKFPNFLSPFGDNSIMVGSRGKFTLQNLNKALCKVYVRPI